MLALDVIGFDVVLFGESNGFHNNLLPVDVDANSSVTPLDALLVINELIERDISDSTGAIDASNSTATFVDVNNDQMVSPIDALLVINSFSDPTAMPAAAANISSVPEPRLSPLLWLFGLPMIRRFFSR